jgi:FkbM family methyltransferase
MNAKLMIRELLPRRQAAHRIMSGPLRGMRIVTSWHDYPAAIFGYTERKLTDWLLANALAGETWLDVGANCGYTSLALSRAVGPQGRVFAFEPALATAACLEGTARANRLDQLVALPLALSDSPRPVVSRVATERGMIDSQLPVSAQIEMTAIIAVGLDAIWDGIADGDRVVHGIKIDVQGMELDALRGMRRLLARYRPKIVLEIHRDVPREKVLALLESCGYLLDNEPIDDTLGAFADPHSNASFLFQANPFITHQPTTGSDLHEADRIVATASDHGTATLVSRERA